MHFVKVEFKLPYWLEPLSLATPLMVKHFTDHPSSRPIRRFHMHLHGLLPYSKRGSFGYFHMCRFFAGAGFVLPFFDDYDYYFRLDSDSSCSKDMPDFFKRMESSGEVYLYDKVFKDAADVVEGLWNFANDYAKSRKIVPTFLNDRSGGPFQPLKEVWSKSPYPDCKKGGASSRGGDTELWEEVTRLDDGTQAQLLPCVDDLFHPVPSFYTNFEVASLKMLRSSEYMQWFEAVDRSGGMFLHRWGDAPLRFLGLSLHTPHEKIGRVQGCQHQ
ncbi:unnamed protein product [Discosporangium mesarthrocarpum]